MTKIKIPKELPKCELLDILAKKANQRKDIDFDFFGRLNEFRDRVSKEVRQINELFPEYTPHDEQFHLKRLFVVTDTILGRDRLESMNSAELFILAVALYGHDWGMAVSKSEKKYIVTGKVPEGISADDMWILPGERDRFVRFLDKQTVKMKGEAREEEISIEIWSEYIRQTHAYRSHEKVRRFFEHINGGVADAASRICLGHWLDFEELRNPESYPTDFSVLRETANLRALAVYLRLTDMLDLAEDRTPYVIWKFVAPRDPYSKMEWKKHRSLRPVTCPPYQEGRIVRVDGSTDDHEVYAALEDLRIWCEEQFKGCSDIMARMNDPRHKLDLYRMDWRLATRGFKKISIQFDFNRKRMFEILSDEIYQGDPYVFLRELLQNSIDAIRMRREVLKRRQVATENLGVIRVNVNHGDNGDAIVTWSDDGIGMDEYIVSNYLAVAGKSYYQSSDFEREGLKIDPISRFGIGVLSYFMVAERIEIETFKDPYLVPQGDPLKIIIPDAHRQFRIEQLPQESSRIGTTVRVFVKGKKLPVDQESKTAKPLDVTTYLSILAGFVEFPIVITEGERKTIILHPKQDREKARKISAEEFEVHQLDLGFPWSEAILPQDLSTANEILREVCWDINSDLKLKGYDGTFTYLVPSSDKLELLKGREGVVARERGKDGKKIKRIRWSKKWTVDEFYRRELKSKKGVMSHSIDREHTWAVFRDGILIPEGSKPLFRGHFFHEDVIPIPQLIVNLPKSKAPNVNLARTQLLRESEHWSLPIKKAHLSVLYETSLNKLMNLKPFERLYQLGRFSLYHRIEADLLWEVFPHDAWPIPFLESGGHIRVIEFKSVKKDVINVSPPFTVDEFEKMSWCLWMNKEKYEGPLTQWKGERCLIRGLGGYLFGNSVLKMAEQLYSFPINKSHVSSHIHFLKPPWEGNPPLFQEVLVPIEIPDVLPDIDTVLEKIVKKPSSMDLIERNVLHYSYQFDLLHIPRPIDFAQPFENSFAYGWTYLNLKHPLTQALLRVAAALELSKIHKTLPEDQLGQIEDELQLMPGSTNKLDDFSKFISQLRSIWKIVRKVHLLDLGEVEDLELNPDEFVPGTTKFEKLTKGYLHLANGVGEMKKIASFGKLLT